MVGRAHDQAHVVLDQQDRQVVLVAQRGDQVAELADLVLAQAAGGLVQHQQPRLAAQGARQLDALEHAVGQARRLLVGGVGQAQLLDRAVGALAELALLAPLARQAERGGQEARAPVHVAAEHHVLAHGQRLHDPQVLEGAGDPEPGDLVRAHASRSWPSKVSEPDWGS